MHARPACRAYEHRAGAPGFAVHVPATVAGLRAASGGLADPSGQPFQSTASALQDWALSYARAVRSRAAVSSAVRSFYRWAEEHHLVAEGTHLALRYNGRFAVGDPGRQLTNISEEPVPVGTPACGWGGRPAPYEPGIRHHPSGGSGEHCCEGRGHSCGERENRGKGGDSPGEGRRVRGAVQAGEFARASGGQQCDDDHECSGQKDDGHEDSR